MSTDPREIGRQVGGQVGRMVADAVAAAIRDALEARPAPGPTLVREEPPPWPERLWTCHPDTLLRVPEVAEALARSTSWVYKRTMADADDPLPCSRLGSDLVFPAGALRAWVRDHLDREAA